MSVPETSPAPLGAALAARSPACVPRAAARRQDDPLQRLLDGLPIPALVISEDRAIVVRNRAFESQADGLGCVSLSYGRVTDFAGASSEPFERVFGRASAGAASSAVIRHRRGDRESLWRVTLCRMSEAWPGADVLMLLHPPAGTSSTLEALRCLYDLTTAEGRVLGLLLDDCRPNEIAQSLGVSITTVRTHLQALFAKTGTRRQSELVRLAWSAG